MTAVAGCRTTQMLSVAEVALWPRNDVLKSPPRTSNESHRHISKPLFVNAKQLTSLPNLTMMAEVIHQELQYRTLGRNVAKCVGNSCDCILMINGLHGVVLDSRIVESSAKRVRKKPVGEHVRLGNRENDVWRREELILCLAEDAHQFVEVAVSWESLLIDPVLKDVD